MNAVQTGRQSVAISQERLLAFVRAMIGGGLGREDDDHPLPPGPWDPVIRSALERSVLVRHPEAADAIGGGHGFGDEVALNPQPLPPRYAFLVAVAQSVVNRAELLQEVANGMPREGERQGIIIVGGYTSRFADDWCGNGFRLKYPFPGPRPHWFAHELNGIDLVVVAAAFDQAAREAFDPELRQSLTNASEKFAATGLSRMQ